MNKLFLFLLGFTFILTSCGNKAATEENKEEKKDSTVSEAPKEAPADKNTLKLKFVDFHFGDAEHYVFEDESGKQWEFGRCEEKSIEFGVELPQKEANSENQGFGPNKELQGKWFVIKYETKKMPLYQDGPEGDVPTIVSAKAAE